MLYSSSNGSSWTPSNFLGPVASAGSVTPGEEASDDTELGNRLWVRVEKSEATGDAGLEETVDRGDSGTALDASIFGTAR